MAYINFKEEKNKVNIQLEKRIKNNKIIISAIKNDLSNINMDYEKKYSFKTFNNKTFNNSKVENEDNFIIIEYKNIICSEFTNCKFNNIHFKGCSFIGCNIINCDFSGGGVIFENCSFYLETINKTPSLNLQDNLSCHIQKSNIYVKFISCEMEFLIIEECNVENTNIELSDMTSAIIINSYINKLSLIDVNMSSAKIIETYISDLEFNDKYKSKVDEKTFFDLIPIKEKTKEEYEGIYKTYEVYADIFKANNLNNNFGEYYYQCKVVQRKSLKPCSKMVSFIYWAVCGYGERIINSIITSFIIILIFTILFLVFGIEIDKEVIRYATGQSIPKSFLQCMKQLNESFSLSIAMFGALGADMAKPVASSYMLANIEIILGVVMTGIGIGTLTRKIVR